MNIIISNSSTDPIYQQIKDQIKQSILRDEIKEGEPLPSMRRLAQDLRISVITTKRAYEELEKEGFITSFVGKGSFVAGQNSDLIQEKRLRMIEDRLSDLVMESRKLDITLEQLKEMLEMLYEGDEE
ncbi:GntR family transcriptional regulator [Natribacillus halophilus]|uniref:GntR family transcriptional regulator n=1 Tax=Natribacillus halophilus TaxID=549003 RepID=A0A1G8SKM0_9BACI|nr:GntR family transcriptional regulator [Natribacillus halophilus]SDJ29789.1 GntR family transcriptional regulator [Natribacillus halophilus]